MKNRRTKGSVEVMGLPCLPAAELLVIVYMADLCLWLDEDLVVLVIVGKCGVNPSHYWPWSMVGVARRERFK